MVLTQNFQKSSIFRFKNVLFQSSCRFQKHALFYLQKTEEPISKTLPRMKFLIKTQFSFSHNENLNELWVLFLKALLILFCALFPLLLGFFKYFKPPADKELLLEEDCNEASQEHVDFDEIEKPFSALSFRFPTYEEFLRSTENVDSVISDTSNENDFLEENCSIPSNPDPNFNLHPREDPEKFPPNDLNFTSDIRIEDSSIKDDDDFDEVDDPVEAITERFHRRIENSDEIESEEDDFIKELQIEIKKAKAKAKSESALPSIPEESEYPIAMEEDLKPWKKEEGFNHKDITKELHKVHKLYTEKMRKYDILNHQKTHAKELKMMQSKGSVDSVLSKGFCGCMPEKKADAKTGENREIDGELELVYVAQLWVSWEFIVWQYKKAMEFSSKEGYGSSRFNAVAEKFEHFKVMIQRFMENESFDEGSRVECYARNRLARRKLLQVPLLKEDEVKDNKKTGGIDDDNDNENIVKFDRLIEILQECIRSLWQFIRADKLVHISTLKSHIEAEQECRSPTHFKILKQILLDLQKKERKLKKMIKRKNCMSKNCKETSEEDDPDDELCFLAMVDLKLLSRVLNMQKITKDQLSWCHHKLSCFSFPNGTIKIEEHSSSFLFPSL